MHLSKDTLHDLKIIIEELVWAFDQAAENNQAMMTLQSHVGSNFHKRVKRVYDDVLRLTTERKK